jgi:Uma2 family endonuclease
MSMVTTKRFTVADLENAGPGSDRFELIQGELREVAAAGARHGAIGMRLAILIGSVPGIGAAGELFNSDTGCILTRDPDTLVKPDISFVRAGRLTAREVWDGFLPFSPDLAVEIDSPSNSAVDIAEKVELYLGAGTSQVWVVSPKRNAITVFAPGQPSRTLSAGETLDGGELLPGFSLLVGELFRGIPDPR